MATPFIEIHIPSNPDQQSWLIALLSDLPINSFWEQEEKLIAYIESDRLTNELKTQISQTIASLSLEFEFKDSEDINWNKEWESNFEPVKVDDYCYIHADFHPADSSCQHSIVVNPKMAFGTAHHPTTYMMIQEIGALELDDKKVVDFGCGTAVLAILAEKENAASIIAIDYDDSAVENAIENVESNHCNRIRIMKGGAEKLDNDQTSDLMLANINRQVLLDARDAILANLQQGGILALSGILEDDLGLITDHYCSQGFFTFQNKRQRGEWLCLRMIKN